MDDTATQLSDIKKRLDELERRLHQSDVPTGTIKARHLEESIKLSGSNLTSPLITTSIKDANGATLATITPATSAVNYLTFANAATAGVPTIGAAGSDTNVSLKLTAQASGYVYPKMLTGMVTCTAATAPTGSETDLTGATITFTPALACTALITGVFDISGNTAGDFWLGLLNVDGVTDGVAAGHYVAAVNDRKTVSQTWRYNLTAASHTIKLRGQRASGAGASTYTDASTRFSYVLYSQ